MEIMQGFDLLAVSPWPADDPVGQRSRLAVTSDVAIAPALGPEELDRGLERVYVEPKLVVVELVESGDRLGRLVAVPANELADVGPVLWLRRCMAWSAVRLEMTPSMSNSG